MSLALDRLDPAQLEAEWEKTKEQYLTLPDEYHDPKVMHASLCGCATCGEAHDAAVKHAALLLENHCPRYLMFVADTMRAMAIVAYARLNTPLPTPPIETQDWTIEKGTEVNELAGFYVGHMSNIRKNYEAIEKALIKQYGVKGD